MINVIRKIARIKEWVLSFRLALIIVGFILAFVAGHYTSVPKCRGMTREAATMIRAFETDKVDAILIILYQTDGKQRFFFHDKKANKTIQDEPKN